MTNLLTQRADELRLLGWTEEGAKRYASIGDDPQIQFLFSRQEIFIGLLVGTIVLAMLAFLGIRLFISNKKIVNTKSLSILSNQSVLITSLKSFDSEYLSEDKSQAIVSSNSYYSNNISISSFIVFFKSISIDTDQVIIHILMIFSLILDALSYCWNIFTNNIDSVNKNIFNNNHNARIQKSLALKSDSQLRSILKGVELLENLDRKNLVQLIESNSIFLNRLLVEDRRLSLQSKKNSELRDLLCGVDKISRLKKSELIDKILFIEFGDLS